MTLAQVFDYASKLTVTAMLIVVIVGGYRKWWVWGYQWRDMKAERDEYRDLFHRSIGVFSEVITGQRVTSITKRGEGDGS